MDDFRHVALASVVAKCSERLACNPQTTSIDHRLDQWQFACMYSAGMGGLQDTTLNVFQPDLPTISRYHWFLRVDFSSDFLALFHFLHCCEPAWPGGKALGW